jgi:hypothetical protein
MPMANGMLVTSPFRLQLVKYRIQKCEKEKQKKTCGIHLFILEHHLFEQRIE